MIPLEVTHQMSVLSPEYVQWSFRRMHIMERIDLMRESFEYSVQFIFFIRQ
ncbi:MAG: hypothetical protein ACMUEM_04020 [Flavobacteriales bacterium AspAUS03]